MYLKHSASVHSVATQTILPLQQCRENREWKIIVIDKQNTAAQILHPKRM